MFHLLKHYLINDKYCTYVVLEEFRTGSKVLGHMSCQLNVEVVEVYKNVDFDKYTNSLKVYALPNTWLVVVYLISNIVLIIIIVLFYLLHIPKQTNAITKLLKGFRL